MKKEKSSLVFALVAVLFCISGVSALTYQVAWQRILALHTGIGVYSVAIIVAVFMAGLGIGSHFGGVISKKVNRKRALFLFGSFELGIGLFAFISCWLYYDILYFKAPNLYNNLLIGTLSHFLSLVVPTFLMGASLPFLVRAMIDKVEKAQVRISYLYGINVVGACIGAIITPWIYIRFFGIREAVIFAGVGNLFTGISAFIIWYIYGNKLVENREDNKKSVIINTKSFESKPFSLWFVLYALSGFIALSLEVLWFRILDVSVKSTAFTFGTMLAIYLFGLALGSIIGAHLVPKIKNLLKAFLTVQCIILLYSALFVILLVYLPKDFPVYRWFYNYWGEYVKYFKLGMTSVSSQFVMLYLVFPLFLYAVPTILMGFSFAILQQSIQHDKESCSLKVGMLQAANIAGCTAGSLIIGLLSINLWGTIGSLRFLMIMGFIFLVIGFKHYKYQNVFLVLLVLMVLFIIFLPSQNAFWQRLHGRMGENALIEEDAAGIISITYHDPDWWMTVNGLRHSKFPYSIDQMHTLLGAIPSILHDSPKDIALIGLAAGKEECLHQQEHRADDCGNGQVQVVLLLQPGAQYTEERYAYSFAQQTQWVLSQPAGSGETVVQVGGKHNRESD